MTLKAYLTIDDSPSADTGALTAFLKQRNIPAVLFCRGDRLQEFPDAAAQAVRDGFVLGNHAFSHQRASRTGFAETVDEIERADALIDRAYAAANAARPAKYFRFPHMDRGTGGWIVDYDAIPAQWRDLVLRLFADGLNISLSPPHEDQKRLKEDLQRWLRERGFTKLPCPGVTFPWFTQTELGSAIDAMFTFSTSDWMITPRHAGKWPYKTLDDLIAKIDSDPLLKEAGSAHIILAHDQEGLVPAVKTLIGHFLEKGFEFQPFTNP